MSEHLDMVGVKLKASYLHTRKTNCYELQEKVKNVIGSWKADKFMPLSQRSHSINITVYLMFGLGVAPLT